MGEPDIAETRAELGAILKDPLRMKKLFALALKFGRGPDRAQELINTACMKLLSGATPWRRSTHPDLVQHMGSVMFTTADHARTSAYARRQKPFAQPEDEELVEDDRAGAEEQLLDDEAERRVVKRLGKWMGALRRDRQGDDEGTTLLDCFARSVLTAADQVTDTGWRIERVRRVRKRLFERAEIVMRENPDESGDYAARGAAS